MIQRCQRLVGGVLAFLVLLVLHLIHGSTLLIALFLHLINYIPLGSSSSCSRRRTISDNDISMWKRSKIPKCLSIIFVPSARGYFSFSKFKYIAWDRDIVRQGMIKDVIDLINWCKELGIDCLLLYDENGIFKEHSSQLRNQLQSISTDVFEISEQTFLLDNTLRITLLCRQDGKEHLAKVTQSIAKNIKAGFVEKDDINVEYIQEKLYSSLCPEPDLLIVLGGLHLRLRGFPPWHTRLCEIYHDSSLSLLGPPRLRYPTFKRAMDNYSGCQQRFGR